MKKVGMRFLLGLALFGMLAGASMVAVAAAPTIVVAQAQDTDEAADAAAEEQAGKAAEAEGPQYSDIWLVATLQKNPALAIFLALAIGYWIGGIKFGNFSLGAVTGTLLAGVLIGQLEITISDHVKSVFFLMFLFAVGYGVGPQFVRGIARDGAPQAIFAAVVSVLCLLTAYGAAVLAGYDVGFAAGLYAGATTISASIGLATDAINTSGLDNASQMLSQIPVAYAVTYLFGTVGTGAILAYLGPTMLGVDLEEECRRYEAEHNAGAPEGGMQTAWRQLQIRAYRVPEEARLVGMPVADAEALRADSRMFVEGIRRDGDVIEFDGSTVLQAGDVIAISGRTDALVELDRQASEVADRELLDIPVEAVDVFVSSKAHDGKTLMELAQEDFARGVYLTKITRGLTSVEIPILADTTIQRGDILKIVGSRTHTDRIVEALGYADRPTTATDITYVGLGIVLGGLVGAIVLPIAGIPITLSTSGGALIAGLIFGWLRGVRPYFGVVPAPALWIMNSVGLNVFIAVVGISAGPGFVAGLQEAGISLFLWGVFVTSIPMLVAPYLGKYVFRFDPAINLGCCGGARTSTASVAMVADAAKSNVPMLGYTVPYAVSNTLLTLWGLVIVLLLT